VCARAAIEKPARNGQAARPITEPLFDTTPQLLAKWADQLSDRWRVGVAADASTHSYPIESEVCARCHLVAHRSIEG
jgi:hypothetical protein